MNSRMIRPWKSHWLLDCLTNEKGFHVGTICYFALFMFHLRMLPYHTNNSLCSFNTAKIPTADLYQPLRSLRGRMPWLRSSNKGGGRPGGHTNLTRENKN